jgi:hypothetical protein
MYEVVRFPSGFSEDSALVFIYLLIIYSYIYILFCGSITEIRGYLSTLNYTWRDIYIYSSEMEYVLVRYKMPLLSG